MKQVLRIQHDSGLRELPNEQQLINTVDHTPMGTASPPIAEIEDAGRNLNAGFFSEYDGNRREDYGSTPEHDYEQIYDRCFQALDLVYKEQFKRSRDYHTLRQEMNENIIEYRFFTHAGLVQRKRHQ